MSLMESFRSGTDSSFMQVIVLAIIISFVGWGVGMSGNSTRTEAWVNGEAINGLEFARVYRSAEQRLSAQQGGLDEDARAELRERVLQDMIQQRALLQEAHALGLEVSTTEIAEELMTYDFLLDDQGRFDTRAFENFLRRQGLTRSNFEEQIRDQLLLQKLQSVVVLGASVSEPAVKRTWVEGSTKLTLDFVRLRSAAFVDSLELSEADIQTYLDEHPDSVRAAYDEDFDRLYDKPASVDLRIIRLTKRPTDELEVADLKAQLEDVRAKAEAGTPFVELVGTYSDDPSAPDGGLLEDMALTSLSEDLAAALEGVEPGGLTAVLEGATDARLYQLVARHDARTVPFDEVKLAIAERLLTAEEAPTAAAAFAEQTLLPAWSETGEAPAEALAPLGLSVQSTGPIPATGGGGLLAPPSSLMKDAAKAEVGDVLPEVYEDKGVLWVAKLTDRQDADLEAYETDKDKIREQALLAARAQFFQGYVDDVVARATVER